MSRTDEMPHTLRCCPGLRTPSLFARQHYHIASSHLLPAITCNRRNIIACASARPMSTSNHVKPNAHPEAPVHYGPHSRIPHPPPEDHPTRNTHETHEIPDTGWRGELPSRKGGTYEKDYMHKPPYEWKSEGDRFKAKYYS